MRPDQDKERAHRPPRQGEWRPEPLHVPAHRPELRPGIDVEDGSEADEDKPGSHVFVIDIS